MRRSLVLSSFFCVVACSSGAPAPVVSAAPARAAAVSAAPTPEQARPAPAPVYTYTPAGKRDPFRGAFEPTPDPFPSCLEPLCRYDLDELKLAGIISGGGDAVAVFENGNGKGYSVHRGARIGKNNGVVKAVLRDAVVVAESYADAQGIPRVSET
ncbi:MAG TPA: pilus assembly protein PilP, partial [Myxococcaceae bacterium]|nr:pilus assembly protein PilP [Myxococcaceae bacterium]